ncbi:DEAD/DEAH box helicase family protein [Rheinheimera sp.]|uniref:DEAD/DEAH box helicase family protein n=1 Tax=Rheinheimera sp. TaxID=1869214 RepID=UPI0040488164
MPFNQLSFRYPWRPYQQRVIDAIHCHLADKKLHIVAAPGAGKTSLGLEVFRLLQQKTLVLSPTRVIRDQWLLRLADFQPANTAALPNWTSTDIRQPGVLTSVTYQALHWQLSGQLAEQETDLATEDNPAETEPDTLNKSEIDCFITTVQQHQIGVLILDEAHHLTNAWWQVLDKLCAALPELVLVSLTATPPYDSQQHNWQRYEQLCGPVDEEISVPELVKAGTLCPHQDYIWTEAIHQSEQKRLLEHDDKVVSLCDSLFAQPEFLQLIRQHKWLNATISAKDILSQPELAVALLAFLAARQQHLPIGLLQILDFSYKDIPELNRTNWQILLSALLFSTDFSATAAQQEYINQLKRQLSASQLLHKRELLLAQHPQLKRDLALNPVKITTCVKIHQLEYQLRGQQLRQVILTDYIRDEAISSGIHIGQPALGAWPVFDAIQQSAAPTVGIALLTGRLSLLPAALLQRHSDTLSQYKLSFSAFEAAPAYVKITGPLNAQSQLVTQLLCAGDIQLLIGTRALLGEGWDAPVVNSLVLASNVGSFMLTNQMRGRAIRLDKTNPAKTSSIWHLLAVDTKSFFGLQDLQELSRRFDTFVGLSERKDVIESGFARLNTPALDKLIHSNQPLDLIRNSNNSMANRLKQQHQLPQRWQKALTVESQAKVAPGVSTSKLPAIRTYHSVQSFKYLLAQFSLLFGLVSVISLGVARTGLSVMLLVFTLGIIGGMLYLLPSCIATARIMWRHLPTDGSLKQIGMALTEALCQSGHISTPFRQLTVQTTELENGHVFLALQGGSFYESSLFADCLHEVLAPIENPRYLVIRAGNFLGMARDDYHAVPLRLATTKEQASIFYRCWSKYVGPGDLIYCRSDSGREQLLKARMQAFSAAFKPRTKRQDRWL